MGDARRSAPLKNLIPLANPLSKLLSAYGASQRDFECWRESGQRPLSSQHSKQTEASRVAARSQRKGFASSI
jgi:hypothetical protein